MRPVERYDVALLRYHQEDDETPEPLDDAVDFPVSTAQRRIHDIAHTRRQMVKVWSQIWGPNGSLSTYAARLERDHLYVQVRRER